MSGNRPDLHTPQHDQWDQGGYCNNLVLDDDGCGTVCGYHAPSDYTPSLDEVREAYVVSRLSDLPTGLELVESPAEFDAWLTEHDAALIEGLAGDVFSDLTPGVSDDTTGSAVFWWLRDQARQRRGEQDHA